MEMEMICTRMEMRKEGKMTRSVHIVRNNLTHPITSRDTSEATPWRSRSGVSIVLKHFLKIVTSRDMSTLPISVRGLISVSIAIKHSAIPVTSTGTFRPNTRSNRSESSEDINHKSV